MAHTTTYVTRLPRCDFHPDRKASYDAKTSMGPWANMCGFCYAERGVGLGLGKGQRLMLGERPVGDNIPEDILDAALSLGLDNEEIMELEELF